MFFAQVTLGEMGIFLGAIFTAFGAILAGFYKYAATREKDFEKSRQLTADSYAKSTRNLSKSLERVAKATERAADEAKERNGHLAELIIEAKGQIMESQQHVTKQVVDKQTIKEVNK